MEQLPDYCKISFPQMNPVDLGVIITTASEVDIQFLYLSIQLDPKKRMSCQNILLHEYFSIDPLPFLTCDFPVLERKNSPTATVSEDLSEAKILELINGTFEQFN